MLLFFLLGLFGFEISNDLKTWVDGGGGLAHSAGLSDKMDEKNRTDGQGPRPGRDFRCNSIWE